MRQYLPCPSEDGLIAWSVDYKPQWQCLCVDGQIPSPIQPTEWGFTKLQSLVYINVVSIMYEQAEEGVMNAELAKF